MDNCWEIYRNVITETGSSSQEVTVNTIQDGLNSADCFVYFSSIGANWLWEEKYLKSKQSLGFIHNNNKKNRMFHACERLEITYEDWYLAIELSAFPSWRKYDILLLQKVHV